MMEKGQTIFFFLLGIHHTQRDQDRGSTQHHRALPHQRLVEAVSACTGGVGGGGIVVVLKSIDSSI